MAFEKPCPKPNNMKRALLFSSVFILSPFFRADAQIYSWANSYGSGSSLFDAARSSTTDTLGNIYVTGLFQGTTDFDPSGSIANLVGSGGWDIFVAKYDSLGAYQWAFKVGGTGFDQGIGIALDKNANIILTGSFAGTVDFNPGVSVNNLATGGTSTDIFLAKYDNMGVYQWAFKVGTTANNEYGHAVAVDTSGNIFISGDFSGSCDFDPSGSTAVLNATGGNDGFLAKYNAAGTYQWAFRLNDAPGSYGKRIVTDKTGNVFITGSFQNTCDFDPSGTTVNLVSSGSFDVYIAKYSAAGIHQWVKHMGGTGADVAYAIAIDELNNILITGGFSNTVDFDPGTGIANQSSLGGYDIFVAKYNSLGDYQWAGGMGSANSDRGYGIVSDMDGNVYVTGYFSDNVDFDFSAGTSMLNSYGDEDVFIAKYSSSGTYNWAAQAGGTMEEECNTICLGLNNAVYTAGYFYGTADFDPSASADNKISGGDGDIFIARYVQQCVAPDVPNSMTSDPNICSGESVTLSIVSGNLNGAANWKWYTGSCGAVATGTGISINISPVSSTMYYVRAEGGCTVAGLCDSVMVTVNPSPFTNAINNDVDCNGNNTGSIDVTVTGGTPGYSYNWSTADITEDISNIPAGNYQLVVMDANSCTDTLNVIITEPTALATSYTTTPETIGNDGTIDFSVTGGTPTYSYVWSNSVTTQDQNGLAGGTYSVIVTDANGCIINDTVTVDSNIGIEGITENQIRLYPNPAMAMIFIELNSAGHIEITEQRGRLVYEDKLYAGKNEISLTGFSQGVYVVKLKSGNDIITRKIIIQ